MSGSVANFGTITQAAATTDPSFIAFGTNRDFLYSVNEGPATVSVFSVNPTNGNLTLLNQLPSGGGAPAYIVVDKSGRNALVANYNGGSVSVFPIQTNGRLGAATAHIQHPGTSPHPHCVTLDSSNHFAFVCDKGLDQIRSYIFDPIGNHSPEFCHRSDGGIPPGLPFGNHWGAMEPVGDGCCRTNQLCSQRPTELGVFPGWSGHKLLRQKRQIAP